MIAVAEAVVRAVQRVSGAGVRRTVQSRSLIRSAAHRPVRRFSQAEPSGAMGVPPREPDEAGSSVGECVPDPAMPA